MDTPATTTDPALPADPPLLLLDAPPADAPRPRRPGRHDRRIADDLAARFARDPELAGVRIRTAVRDGVVALEGYTCATSSEAAERLAAAVPGVVRVDNHLRVRDPWRPSDDDLRRMVAAALAGNGHARVDAVVADGAVVLTGAVPGDGDRAAAERVARTVAATLPGRTPVANHIVVDPTATAAADLAAAIEAAFVAEARREAAAVSIRIAAGTAVLDGAVRDPARRELAARAALAAGGVSRVENRLRIGRG